MTTEHRRASCSDEEAVTISPHECSVEGGQRMLVTFPEHVPGGEPVFLVFSGSRQRHEITTGRHSPTSLYATIPAHSLPEVVDLSVCVLDENGEQKTLYKTQFAYVTDQKQYMAQLLLGSVSNTAGGEGGGDYPIFPPLPSAEALREYDQSLTDALMDSDLPPGWTLVGYNNHNTINSIQDCTHRETLLHFAARHGLNSLAQYLLSLPGSGMAAILPNEQGQLPIDLAREQGNNGLAELLTLFMKQVRPNGVMEDSPLPSPVTSPNHTTEVVGVSVAREGEEPKHRKGVKRSLEGVEELSKFKEINDQWKSEVKRHKTSSNSTLNNNNNTFPVHQESSSPLAPANNIPDEILDPSTTNKAKLDRALLHTHLLPRSLPKKKRRSSVAIMSSTLAVPAVAPAFIPLESVDFNVTDPSVADMNRKRRTSWSYIVGNCDSRSIDTGLNELDRITAEDFLCKRLVDMRGGIVDLGKQAVQDQNHLNDHQNQLNLLYRLSISCPMLNEADDEDALSSFISTPGEVVSPFNEDDENDTAVVIPPPREFSSERSVSRSDTCSSADSQRHLRPTAAIPEVITTEYSDQTSSAEDLLSADDALSPRVAQSLLRRQAQSDSQLVENSGDKEDLATELSKQNNHTKKEYRSLSPSLDLLDNKEDGERASSEERRLEPDTQNSDANLLETETAGMSSSAPDLLSMTSEEIRWLQSATLNQQSSSTDALEMESIVEHRSLRQQVGSDERIETNMDTSNTSAEDDFILLHNNEAGLNKVDVEGGGPERGMEKEDSVSPSPMSPSSRKSGSTSSTDATSISGGDRSVRTPTPSSSGSQRLKSHRRSLSTSEVDILKDVHKLSEDGHDSNDATKDGWKPMANISEAKSSQSLNKSITSLASEGLKGGDLERSRASSLHTNETYSPHESEESSDDDIEDDDFLSAKETISKTSLDQERADIPSATVQDSNDVDEEQSTDDNMSKLKPPTTLAEVVFRKKKGASLPSNRYSADHIISHIDDYMDENGEDVLTPTSLAALSHRRINSTTTSMLPTTSESDYNLRQHLSSTSAGEQNDGSLSSNVGTSSITSQDVQHLAVTSPQQKDSTWTNDSVFEHETGEVLNASDVDVKVVSDDSLVQSLESSLDHSLSSSLQFEPGSSGSMKKRVKKSPLVPRRNAGSDKESTPVAKRKGGLTKKDVEPTIKSLRNLVSQDNFDDLSSDDDAVKGEQPGLSLCRTPSGVSDSSTIDNKEEIKQGTLPRAPLSPAVSACETECTSLDFVPNSPLAIRRQAQLAEQTSPHPPSPLSFYQAKSPPGSSQSINSERKIACTSPNSIPSSPATSNKLESGAKLSQGEGKEEDDELTSLKSISEVTVVSKHTSLSRRSQKMRQAMSFDEAAGGSQPYSELLNEIGEAAAKEHSEEELSDPKTSGESVPPPGKDNEGGIKKSLFTRDLFRRSKSSKKVNKVKKSGEAEQIPDPAVSLVQKQAANRPRSAARIQSMRANREVDLKDDELTFMTPQDYSTYKERERREQQDTVHALSSSVDIHRSVSMQVKLNHTGGHSRSSSLQVNDPSHIPLTLGRRTSDDLSAIPKRAQSDGHVLTPLDEERHTLASPTRGQYMTQPSGESDIEEGLHEEEQLAVSDIVANPVLAIPEELSWDKTVNRKLYKKMNKTERDRQSILHELLQTEKRYFRVLHVLKLIFRQTLSKHVSEEVLDSMFPELNNLIEISNNFSRKLESKYDGSLFDDCSEILFKQFSAEMYDRTLEAFGNFCSCHLTAVEVYKEHMKKKHFARIMKDLHSLKECQRLTLPDYYTHVTQHLSKILTLLKRLTKKTEDLKLPHAPRLRQALQQLEKLMSGVNKTVEYHKNRMELMHIQERLEVVNVPKSVKITDRKDLKNLSLVAFNRMLRKSGEAMWIGGHGKTLAVYVVLVTDILVLLTERDQKYRLATLQEYRPPVIRLYDLHVRLDAAVKSGVQLLLLEKGPDPEMFRLQFVTKSEAKLWDNTLNSAIEECKKKGLKAEHFGEISGEKLLLSGDEEKRESDQEETSAAMSSVKKAAPKAVSIQEPSSSARVVQRAKDSMELAGRLLSQLSSSSTTTADASSAQRYQGAAVASSGISRPFLRDSPKNRQRSQTGHSARPKTAYYGSGAVGEGEAEPGSGTSATLSGDHVISYPVPPGAPFTTSKTSKQSKEKKKTKLDRSATFKGKEKEKERERERLAATSSNTSSAGGDSGESARIPEQQMIDCIKAMKDSLEEMVSACEEKDEEISNLRKEKDEEIGKLKEDIARLREIIQSERREEDQSPMMSRHNSHSHARPRSMHIDLSDREDVLSRLDSNESPNLRELTVANTNRNSNLNSVSKRKELASDQDGNSSSQETENLNITDTGT